MLTDKYILSIDQGTTSTRCIIFDSYGQIKGLSQMEFTQICPQSGWVEHNALEIWETVCQTMRGALNNAKININMISGISITNQRETTVIWNKKTGLPVYNAICWQSRQSQDICEDWIKKGYNEIVKEKTGLIINPYFSASKIRWLLDKIEVDDVSDLLFGTIDSFIVWKLSNGKYHVTDYTNASRTMLFNINTLKWDQELLDLWNIPVCILPEVVPTSGISAYCEVFDGVSIPIASIVGDQQASLFGHCCFNMGDAKSTYGTGCFILMNTKDTLVHSKNGLITTIAWNIEGRTEYALEGSVFVAGSAVQWLRDGLRIFEKSSDCENYLRNKTSNGVYLVPAFVGLGTPYWDNDARGAIFGLTRASSIEDVVTATIESIAYQASDVIDVMKEEASVNMEYLGVDGGASSNNYLMQFQADILNAKLIRPICLEMTALGSMYLAGLALGIYEDIDEIRKMHQVQKVFFGHMTNSERMEKLDKWHTAVKATMQFK